jgi:hypothetical protein
MPTIASGPRRTDDLPKLPYSMTALQNITPNKINGLLFWLDASDPTSLTLSNDGQVNRVISWRDKSINAVNLNIGSPYAATSNFPFQSTIQGSAYNTVYFSTGMTAIRSAATVSGVRSFFFISPQLQRVPGTNPGDMNSVFLFGSDGSFNWHGGQGTPFSFLSGNANTPLRTSTGLVRAFNMTSNNLVSQSNTLINLTPYTSANTSILLWNTTISSTATTNFNGIGYDRTNLGPPVEQSRGYPGHIGEIIMFNRNLNAVEEAQMVSYLVQKWSLQCNVPGEATYNQSLFNTAAVPRFFTPYTQFSTIVGFRFLTYTLPISNAVLWWDAMDITTFRNRANVVPTRTTDSIQFWFDKIHGSSGFLANSAPQPRFNMFGINRYPCIETYNTASGQGLQGRDGALNSNVQFTGCNLSAFIVYAHDQTNNNHVIFSLSCNFNAQANSNVPFDFTVSFNNPLVGVSRFGSGNTPFLTAPIQKGVIQLIEVMFNSSSTSIGGVLPSNTIININGLYNANTTFLTGCNFNFRSSAGNSWLGILRGQNFGGGIGGAVNEISVFYRTINTRERVAMENQLLAKWGIGRNQPVSYLATGVPVVSGLQMWYDAYSPEFVTVNASNQVTSWLDRSGNGYHMSNGTFSSNLPVYSTITGQTHLLPSLFFQYNTSNNYSYLQNYDLQSNTYNNFSVIYAGYFTKQRLTGEPRVVSFMSTINGNDDYIFGQTLDSLNPDRTPGQNINYTNLNLSNFVIKSSFLNLSSNTQGAIPALNNTTYVNGSNIRSNVITVNPGNWVSRYVQLMASGLAYAPQFGGDRAAGGYLNEVLIYNRCLTLSEITSVHTYLLNKWNIANPVLTNVPVTSGLNLWLDAYDSAQVVRDSAGSVWLWRDKSGCNFHFSNVGAQGPQALRPTYSTVGLGGLPGVLFFSDGTLRTSLSCLNINYPSTPNLSIFVVFQQRSNVSFGGRLVCFTSNTNPVDFNFTNGFSIIHQGTTNITIQRSNAFPNASGINTIPNLVSAIFNGSSTVIPDINISNAGLGRNGVIVVNSSNGSLNANFSFNQGWLGTRNGGGDATSYYDGFLSEILLYNRTVTFTERQQIESYLLNKWNI